MKFLEHFPWLQNTAHIGSLGKEFAKPDARRPLRGMLVNAGEGVREGDRWMGM